MYCLYVAGGATERVHTEDVTLKCWELFPDSFSWTKYPRYPDKDIVRVALTDARKDKYGALVSGRVEGNKAPAASREEPEGWILTDKGLAWIKEHLDLFGDDAARHERKAHRQLLLRRVRDLTASDLYRRFADSGTSFTPTIGELAAFLKCRVDASPVVWDRRFADIRRLGIDAGDDAVSRFAAACSDAYQRQR